MRSKIARQIQAETPAEVTQFVKKYGDIVVRIHQILEEKGWTQKDLAEKLDKKPSEISKWLSGNHNLTLRSIAKLEAELGADIINVPVKMAGFTKVGAGSYHVKVAKVAPVKEKLSFTKPSVTVQEDDQKPLVA